MKKDEAEFLMVLKDVLGPYGFSPDDRIGSQDFFF